MEVVIGRVTRAHGVRGEVSVEVRTDQPERRFATGAVIGTDPLSAGPLTVDSVRDHGGRLLVRFAGVGDRDAADGLRGVLLTAPADDSSGEAPNDAPYDASAGDRSEDGDAYYPRELVGLRVVTDTGDEVGEVAEVVPAPAHDLLRVRHTDGADALVPFVAALVPEVDLAAGRLVVADRPGLLRPDGADVAEPSDSSRS